MRVVIVTHTATLGGAELALLRLCTHLDRSRVDPVVVCFEEGPLVDRLQEAGVQTQVVPWGGATLKASRADARSSARVLASAASGVRQTVRVARAVRRLRPDLVQSWTLKSNLVCTFAGPALGAPLAWYAHDRFTDEYLGRDLGRLMRLLARRPAVLIANSHATGQTTGRPYVVAYPGLTDEQLLTSEQVRTRTTPDPPILLMLGRISPTKGQLEAIRAFEQVHGEWPDARLRIVGAPMFGEDAYLQACRDLVARRGLGKVVQFVGHVDEPTTELDRATALVHASPAPEPFGQVITEAMGRGVPVIATAAGGALEILADSDGGALGVLVTPGDVQELATAMGHALQASAEERFRCLAAHQRCLDVFSISQTVAVATSAWRRAARSTRGKAAWTRPGRNWPGLRSEPGILGGRR